VSAVSRFCKAGSVDPATGKRFCGVYGWVGDVKFTPEQEKSLKVMLLRVKNPNPCGQSAPVCEVKK